VDNDLTKYSGDKSQAASRSALAAYAQSDNSQHVDFIDTGGHVHELYRSPDPTAQWVDNDLTMYSGEKSQAASGSPLAAYSQSDNSQHVNFIDEAGHVHELYRSPDPTAQWVDNDLTMYSGEKSQAHSGSALAAYSQNNNSQHVDFVGEAGHVHELYRSPDPTAQWVDNDLTMYSGEKSNAAAGSSLAAYSQGDNSQHVNFIDDFGHVHELYRSPNPTAQWVDRAYPVNADAR